MLELPQISAAVSCDNCGACCMQMRSPPFIVYLKNQEKATYLATAPKAARQLYVARLFDRSIPDDAPCVWLDLKTKKCRFYDHRPIVCRDFEVGEDACLGHRLREGVQS